jgi:hypothetical protein
MEDVDIQILAVTGKRSLVICGTINIVYLNVTQCGNALYFPLGVSQDLACDSHQGFQIPGEAIGRGGLLVCQSVACW